MEVNFASANEKEAKMEKRESEKKETIIEKVPTKSDFRLVFPYLGCHATLADIYCVASPKKSSDRD